MGRAGPKAVDCSGLIAYAFAMCQYPNLIATWSPANGTDHNTDGGPNGIFDYFVSRGATVLTADHLDQAVEGDLLFVVDASEIGYAATQNSQDIAQYTNFAHVAFCSGPGQSFGAYGGSTMYQPIGTFTDTARRAEGGAVYHFNLGLSMSGVSY